MVFSTLAFWVVLGASVVNAAPASRATQSLPSFVLDNAPISYLYSKEEYWPADIAEHLTHVTPQVDKKNVADSVTFSSIATLSNDTYLTSKDDVQDGPSWLLGVQPDSTGFTQAPATIITVEKPGGIIDAFYFYFYSFDFGEYLGLEFGSHVGDWEHSMVRFANGQPDSLYLSAHSGGSAYKFDAVPKLNGRPITYIATGTHANYIKAGTIQHDAPLLVDHTDAGHLWDVTKNFRGFTYDNSTGVFASAGGVSTGGSEQGGEGVGWLNFGGHWGDQEYTIIIKDGQYCVTPTECKFVDGPTGPKAKNLGRTAVCQKEADCTVNTSV
ncbi:hypothetical protein BDW22DRAFT_1363334 [Trametopsis cervina]|nr:hypothetical protein BDW22DRAFT_1363334 [Trametopsis cervina]